MNRTIERSAFFFLLFLPIIPWIAYLSFFILLLYFIRKHKFKHIPLNHYTYALLATVFLSCIFSINKLVSFGAFAIFICYFLSYFIFANVEIPGKRIMQVIVLSGIILAVIGIGLYLAEVDFLFEHSLFRIKLAPRTSTLGNQNRFAKYLVLTIPIAFATLLFQRPFKEKVLPLVFMPLAFLSLWITQSLAGMIATFVALLVVLWGRNKWVALAVLIIGVGFYGVNYKKVNNLTTSHSSYARINTLKYIVPKIFKDSPVTGCGLGAYRQAVSKYNPEKRVLHYHAHNLYAHYLCETGILGLSAFLLFLVMFLYHSIRFFASYQLPTPAKAKRQTRITDYQYYWLILGGTASIIGLLIHGIAETCIDYLPIGVFFFSLIGIVTGISKKQR